MSKVLEMSNEHDEIKGVLEDNKYITFDKYNPDDSIKEILDAVWEGEKVRFYPVKSISKNGVELQVVSFAVGDLPTDLFRSWTFKLEDFISNSPEEDKPIKNGTAVGFYGRGSAWLYAHLCIPLYNKKPVFVYNADTKGYICVYATRNSKHLLGTTIKEIE